MGRSTGFRQQLRVLSEIYLLAVPSNTRIRDLEASLPPYQGHGAPRKVAFIANVGELGDHVINGVNG